MTMKSDTNSSMNPRWWTDAHASTWERAKEALKRDWEQTKADVSKKLGHDLNQNAGDTVAQAAGKQPMPPANEPNAGERRGDWSVAEPAVRYGHAARSQYGDHKAWDSSLESKLKTEWNDLKSGRTWDDVKSHVRHGWESAKR